MGYRHMNATGCKRIGATLQAARVKRGFTQPQLAAAMSKHTAKPVTRAAVAAWENGTKGIPVAKLAFAEKALNVTFPGYKMRWSSHHGYVCISRAAKVAISRIARQHDPVGRSSGGVAPRRGTGGGRI